MKSNNLQKNSSIVNKISKYTLVTLIKCCLLICVLFSFNTTNAETQKERIERMQKSVIVKENGDVLIPYNNLNLPSVSFDGDAGVNYMKQLFLPIIFHIAPDLDYQKLLKTMEMLWKKANLTDGGRCRHFYGHI